MNPSTLLQLAYHKLIEENKQLFREICDKCIKLHSSQYQLSTNNRMSRQAIRDGWEQEIKQYAEQGAYMDPDTHRIYQNVTIRQIVDGKYMKPSCFSKSKNTQEFGCKNIMVTSTGEWLREPYESVKIDSDCQKGILKSYFDTIIIPILRSQDIPGLNIIENNEYLLKDLFWRMCIIYNVIFSDGGPVIHMDELSKEKILDEIFSD